MRHHEAAKLARWAVDEGWNPGKADISIAWETDRDAFIALRKDDDLLGGGTIFSYDGLFGFMGLFIIRSDLRGEGLGKQLWTYRLKRLQTRLAPGAPIGMDGVFAMVPFYERGGFGFAHKDVRFQGIAQGTRDAEVLELDPGTVASAVSLSHGYKPNTSPPSRKEATSSTLAVESEKPRASR